MDRRILLAAMAATAAAAVLPLSGTAMAAYPDRPITVIVPWAAGGGTDATARIVAALLEKELGQPVNVENRTGGAGVVGFSAIAEAAPDGYTIGMATVELGMMHWQGITELDWQSYTPLALVNEDPGAVYVATGSQWQDLPTLLADVKAAEAGTYKASGAARGAIWHLAMAGLLKEYGGDPASVEWVPLQGAAPSLQELISGGVDFVIDSVPEGRSLLDANRIRLLAVLGAERDANFPDAPTVEEAVGVGATGKPWNVGAWRGLVGPKDMPADVAATLTAAIEKVYNSPEYAEFMGNQGLNMRWLSGEDFAAFLKDRDESLGAVMKEVGLVQ